MSKLSFLMVLMITIFSFSIISMGQNPEMIEAQIVYEVTNSNNNTALWFNLDFSQSFHYNVENGSFMKLNITDLRDSSSEIYLDIGNLSRNAILDDEAESALALGYWKLPSTFGFVISTNWNSIKSNFTDLELNSSTFDDQLKFQIDGELRDVVSISLYDGSQLTNLLYDKDLGYLIKAYTTFLGFELGFNLISILIPSLSMTEIVYFPWAFLLLMILTFLLIRKRIYLDD